MSLSVGSKSPLAIVDSFYLSSVKNGIQYDYLWIKEKGQIPTPIFQGSDKVPNKESGITITVPLGSSNKVPLHNLTSYVKEKANNQLFGFKNTVRIVENVSVPYDQMVDVTDKVITYTEELDLPDITFFNTKDSDNTGYGNSGYYSKTKAVYIRVGLVCYKYNDCNKLDFSFLSKYIRNSKDFVVTINVPVGLLDIPMSREEINSTSENFNIIKDCLVKAELQLKNHYDSIVFSKDCGAIEFHNRLKTFVNTSTIVYNISADKNYLKKHDKKLSDGLNNYFKDKNQQYSFDIFFNNVDLYDPITSYLKNLSILVNQNGFKFSRISQSTNELQKTYFHNLKFDKNNKTLIVLLSSKLPYGTKNTDLLNYINSIQLDSNGNSIKYEDIYVIQYKSTPTSVTQSDYEIILKDLKNYIKTVVNGINLIKYDNNSNNGSIELFKEINEQDFKDFVKNHRAANGITTIKNEYLVGIRCINVEKNSGYFNRYSDSYTETELRNTYSTILFKNNEVKYRFERKIDAKGKPVSFGLEYIDTTLYKNILLTVDNNIPILNKNAFYSTLRSFEIDPSLKNTCAIKVSEKQYDAVKKSLSSSAAKSLGINLYTKDNPLKIKIPTLESLYLNDLNNSSPNKEYAYSLCTLIKKDLLNLYNYQSWKSDKKLIENSIKTLLTEFVNNYSDKNNVYYKVIVSNLDYMCETNKQSTVEYNYDSASFKTFTNVLKEKVIENIVKDKYSLISNIDSIINYSTYSSITVDAIFKQFGWDL